MRHWLEFWPTTSTSSEALPLGIAIFLSIGYTRVAVFLLEFRLGPLAVAEFSAAHRLVEPAQIVPAALLAAVFPAFSAALSRNPRQAGRRSVTPYSSAAQAMSSCWTLRQVGLSEEEIAGLRDAGVVA